jgi:hypothetical protein
MADPLDALVIYLPYAHLVNSTCMISNVNDDFGCSEHWNSLHRRAREIKPVQVDFPEILVVVCFKVNNTFCEIPKRDPLRGFLKNGLFIRHGIGYQTKRDIKRIDNMLGKIKRSFGVRLPIGEPGQHSEANKSARRGEVAGKAEHS